MDWGRLRPPDDIERSGLMSIAAKAPDFEIVVSGIDGIAERWRRLRWPLVAEHAAVPRLARQPVGFLPSYLGPLR